MITHIPGAWQEERDIPAKYEIGKLMQVSESISCIPCDKPKYRTRAVHYLFRGNYNHAFFAAHIMRGCCAVLADRVMRGCCAVLAGRVMRGCCTVLAGRVMRGCRAVLASRLIRVAV